MHFFKKTKLQSSKIYRNIWEDFKDIFEYERKNIKLSHVSFFLYPSLTWERLVPVWYSTIKTSPSTAVPVHPSHSTGWTPKGVHSQFFQ